MVIFACITEPLMLVCRGISHPQHMLPRKTKQNMVNLKPYGLVHSRSLKYFRITPIIFIA
jgi:hypothetical protein